MMHESGKKPLRKLDVGARRREIGDRCGLSADELCALGCEPEYLDLSDVMVENCAGYMRVPLGVAEGFVVDGEEVLVPMATEEPSVVAAASFAAGLVGRHGGFQTDATDTVMTAQIFIQDADERAEHAVLAARPDLIAMLEAILPRLVARGGGPREIRVNRADSIGGVVVCIDIDVRDAMGANLLNTAAEGIRQEVEALCGGRALMSILTNSAERRLASACFAVPAAALSRASRSHHGPDEIGRRIAAASAIAHENRDRAVTHNKGIMNGVTALALATGNDTRGIEAAAHAWAARSGTYRSLSVFSYDNETVHGRLEMPLPFASVGGAVSFHPAARAARKIMGDPDAKRTARIAAAVGLAQNLAAVFALVTTGIQRGHMGLHARRLAYQAGARGCLIDDVAKDLTRRNVYNLEAAARALAEYRGREKE